MQDVRAHDPRHIVVSRNMLERVTRPRHPMRSWTLALLASHRVIWPPGSPEHLDVESGKTLKHPLYLLERAR